jgi:Restriction endonuclease fold toxin 5
VIVVAAVAVLALVAGGALFVVLRQDNRKPFDEAVRELTGRPALHYQMSVAGAAMDVRVTAAGDMTGTLTLAGLKFGVLSVGGKSYLKPPDDVLGSLGGSRGTTALAGRWVTGGNAAASAVAQQALGPIAMGAKLYEGLASARFPGRFDSGTKLNGVTVLRAKLPTGDLYVTKNKPYRVVRFAARTGGGQATPGPSLPSLPTIPSLPAIPSLPGLPGLPSLPAGRYLRALALTSAPGGTSPGGMSWDLEPASPADFTQTYDDLQVSARQLVNAVDATVQFAVRGSANVSCSPAGCVVTANVTNTVSGTGSTRVTGATVSAQMTATVFLNGRMAGTCTSAPTPLPAGGAGALTCTAPAAGAVYSAIVAQASASGRGGVVTITATGTAEVVANANVQAEVERQVRDIERERQLTLRGPSGTLRQPPAGETDGGPGRWVPVTRSGSARSQAYQERGTGIQRGMEYKVGNREFDGYENGVLIDAKDRYYQFFNKKTQDWHQWWRAPRKSNNYRSAGYDEMLKEARGQVAAARGVPIEWRVSDPQFAAALYRTFTDEGITGIRIRYFP